ncbi:MAG TPA: ferrochelatase [Steroidobacteraceae bacterium]|nr:ferrochelatase [Steroidobacteraceae bacterium]
MARTGVLLVNTGTPDAPRAPEVRRFLRRFLSDPRVVELPRVFWLPLLNAVVLPVRGPKSARKYRNIWMDGGSPLAVYSEQLRVSLQQRLDQLRPGAIQVANGFLYSDPLLPAALQSLRDAGAERIVVFPVYPQASGSTTGAVFDQVAAASRRWREFPHLQLIGNYCEEPAYIAALASSVREHWQRQGREALLLMSFHGIPHRYVRAGDQYEAQCRATAAALAEALQLQPHQWRLSFQSRFGADRWLSPATDSVLRALPGEGVRLLDVICPGFAVDCLETLEEIALEGRHTFLAAGGERFTYLPALNARADHADAFAKRILSDL